MLLDTIQTKVQNKDAIGVFTAIMSSADRDRRVLLYSYAKEVVVYRIYPDALYNNNAVGLTLARHVLIGFIS